MANSLLRTWSNNPNAPDIPHPLYILEKSNLAGIVISSTSYGIIVILFCQCMGALFSPTNNRSIKWALAAHTMAMFSLVTITTATNLDIQSVSYIDNREFVSGDDFLFPGPIGYQTLLTSKAISIVPDITFLLNTLLADGLLLYRCYIIYAKNHWAVSFPCFMYLSCLISGIIQIYYLTSKVESNAWISLAANLEISYYSISLSLNVLLTLMIIARLIRYGGNIRNTKGASAGATGLYKALITMFIESYSLYAATFLLFIGSWAANSWAANIFFPILAETQVIAPFLIVLRIATRSALTSDVITSSKSNPLRFRSEWRSANGNLTQVGGSHQLNGRVSRDP